MPFCRYVCCPCLLCCKRRKPHKDDDSKVESLMPASTGVAMPEEQPAAQQQLQVAAMNPQDVQDYQDLQYVAEKRQIKITIRKSTQAGVAAGLSVMAGTLVAGPAGAVAGGAVGTALAAKISKDVVPLNKLLEDTPPEQRGEVIKLFNETFKEEFIGTIQDSPELKLLLTGHSPVGVVRYMVERDLVKSDKLDKLDGILKKVSPFI